LTENGSPRYLVSGEAAKMLGVSPRTVGRWAEAYGLPYFLTLGGHRRFLEETILALREALTEPGVGIEVAAGRVRRGQA
jgi:excisionase family DNA binding protein